MEFRNLTGRDFSVLIRAQICQACQGDTRRDGSLETPCPLCGGMVYENLFTPRRYVAELGTAVPTAVFDHDFKRYAGLRVTTRTYTAVLNLPPGGDLPSPHGIVVQRSVGEACVALGIRRYDLFVLDVEGARYTDKGALEWVAGLKYMGPVV